MVFNGPSCPAVLSNYEHLAITALVRPQNDHTFQWDTYLIISAIFAVSIFYFSGLDRNREFLDVFENQVSHWNGPEALPWHSCLIRASVPSMGRGTDKANQLAYELKSKDKCTKGAAIIEIALAFDEHGGNVVHTAKALGVGLSTLRRWIVKHPSLYAHLFNSRKTNEK